MGSDSNTLDEAAYSGRMLGKALAQLLENYVIKNKRDIEMPSKTGLRKKSAQIRIVFDHRPVYYSADLGRHERTA